MLRKKQHIRKGRDTKTKKFLCQGSQPCVCLDLIGSNNVMPPRGNNNSNSESESRTKPSNTGSVGTNTRTNTKQRLSAAQQQYLKELNRKHIHDNHPKNFETPHPLDFEYYSNDFLRHYKDRFKLNLADNLSIHGFMLGSQIGCRTYSYKRNNSSSGDSRITKSELAKGVRNHFDNYAIREAECVPQFIYKVKNSKKKFRMEFKG